MRSIINSVIIIVFIFLTVACNRIAPENRVLHQSKDDAVLVVDIPKAGCKNCQKVIETGLLKEKGVKQTILNLHTKQVSVVYNPKVMTGNLLKTKTLLLADKIPCK